MLNTKPYTYSRSRPVRSPSSWFGHGLWVGFLAGVIATSWLLLR